MSLLFLTTLFKTQFTTNAPCRACGSRVERQYLADCDNALSALLSSSDLQLNAACNTFLTNSSFALEGSDPASSPLSANTSAAANVTLTHSSSRYTASCGQLDVQCKQRQLVGQSVSALTDLQFSLLAQLVQPLDPCQQGYINGRSTNGRSKYSAE